MRYEIDGLGNIIQAAHYDYAALGEDPIEIAEEYDFHKDGAIGVGGRIAIADEESLDDLKKRVAHLDIEFRNVAPDHFEGYVPVAALADAVRDPAILYLEMLIKARHLIIPNPPSGNITVAPKGFLGVYRGKAIICPEDGAPGKLVPETEITLNDGILSKHEWVFTDDGCAQAVTD